MNFESPLIEGRFCRRYKRFFAEIELPGGKLVTAHVPNTGSLKSCLNPGSPCRLVEVKDPRRKLKFTLQMIKTQTSWVGVNTHLSNELGWEAFHQKKISHWETFDHGQREVKISQKSRIDLVLWKEGFNSPAPQKRLQISDFDKFSFHFVEVKNVTLAENSQALFPDAVSTRGQKHLKELMDLLRRGHSAEIFYTVQREDCLSFAPAQDIDPEYCRLLKEAIGYGLKATAVGCQINRKGITLDPDQCLPIKL
ncbi:MAG: DNA/RNA nuclease SfsA [Bdellovibrionales bacterium]|nr:DNA/RNA nuclease SfsA [Bdellovibrionales bacterium]